MKNKIANALDLSNLHNKTLFEFEQHKKNVVIFLTEQAKTSLLDKISESLPLGLALPVKANETLYAQVITLLVKFRERNKRSVTQEGQLNQARLFDMIQTIIIHHPAILTPQLMVLWSTVEWSVFLDELYQKANLDNAPFLAYGEQISSIADKNVQRLMARAKKIKMVFERFETLITQQSPLPLRNVKSESQLHQDNRNDGQHSSPKTARHPVKRVRAQREQGKAPLVDNNGLAIEVERISPKKHHKARLKSASSAVLFHVPEAWVSIYDNIRLSLNSLNAALSATLIFPHAPSLEKEMAQMASLAASMDELLQPSNQAEKGALLALDKAASIQNRYDDVKGFDAVDPAISLAAFEMRITLLKTQRHELSLEFLEQDTPERKMQLRQVMDELKQRIESIDAKMMALTQLFANMEKKKRQFEKTWAHYEAEQKTVLPAIKQQKEAQIAVLTQQLSEWVEQKKSLLSKLNQQRGALQLDIHRLEAAKTKEGHAPIKVCDALIAVFEDKAARLLCEREQMRTTLIAQKNALFDQWRKLESEEKKTQHEEKALISLIPNLTDSMNASIMAMRQAKEELDSKRRYIRKEIAEINSYDDDVSFDYQLLDDAIQKLDEDIQVLQKQRNDLSKCIVHYREAQAAKMAFKKMLKASRANIESLTFPTARCAEGIFKDYEKTLERLDKAVQGAYADKVLAFSVMGQELKDFAHTSQAIVKPDISGENNETLNKVVSAQAAIKQIETLSQSVYQQKQAQLNQTAALLEEMDTALQLREQQALPKRRARLLARIRYTLSVNYPVSQETNKELIQRTFNTYQQRFIDTRRGLLEAPDFLLPGKEKSSYLQQLTMIQHTIKGTLKTDLAQLEEEETHAYRAFVDAMCAVTAKCSLADALVSSAHLANLSETKAQEEQVDTLIKNYSAQKNAIAEKRAALYTDSQRQLEMAMGDIEAIAQEANKKITARGQRVLTQLGRGVFYTAMGLAISSPVLVGVLEGMLAGFIAGVATGGIGLPFWLAAGAIVGGAVGLGISSSSTFFAHKAKQMTQANIALRRHEKTLALEEVFKKSEFNLATPATQGESLPRFTVKSH